MTYRTLFASLALLSLVGCGCTDDSFFGSSPEAVPSSLRISTLVPPCAIEPPEEGRKVRRIDVFFLLDDSLTMEAVKLGIIPFNPEDDRTRTFAAQRIMNHLRDNIQARVQAANPGMAFDFAFGVGRYEDFGGSFTNRAGDRDARPFLLNLPVLRTASPGFDGLFDQALARTAPGDGNPVVNGVRSSDPQTGIEALYQLATGAGYDADGGGTTGSGGPCSVASQTAPGDSGDVPAVQFVLNAATDPDGHVQYLVQDENGVTTQIPDPANPQQQIPCIASGNLGGVGWRPDAARFVILASDIATASPFLATPAPNTVVGNTDGAPDAPRGVRGVPASGFDGNYRVNQGDPSLRFGAGATVAPAGAATVPDTVAALNALDIEVLCIGFPLVVQNDVKPNGGVDPGDPNTPSDVQRVTNFAPTLTAYTWMTAVARLTANEVQTTQLGGGLAFYEPVYNGATVWPYVSEAEQFNEANITDDVLEDLAYRIQQWIDGGFLKETALAASAGPRPPLPTLTWNLRLTLSPGPGFSDVLTQTAPGQNVINVLNVPIPVYWSDDPAPNPVRVDFTTLQYQRANDQVPVPATDVLPFLVQVVGGSLGNVLPGQNDAEAQALRDKTPGQLNALQQVVPALTQGQAAAQITVRAQGAPGTGALLTNYQSGCVILQDLTPGGLAGEQRSPNGSCAGD